MTRRIAKLKAFFNVLLQAWMPSAHVCSNIESLESPHFLNQAPPRAQQLRLPDFLVVPHLGHPVLLLGADVLVVVSAVPVVVSASVGMMRALD